MKPMPWNDSRAAELFQSVPEPGLSAQSLERLRTRLPGAGHRVRTRRRIRWIAIAAAAVICAVPLKAALAGRGPQIWQVLQAAMARLQAPPLVPAPPVVLAVQARPPARLLLPLPPPPAPPLSAAPIVLAKDPPPAPAAAVPPPAPVPAPSPLPAEVALLDRALGALRAGDAVQALDRIADYRSAFAAGALGREVDLAELQADLALGRDEAALRLLDGFAEGGYRDLPRAQELKLARLELWAKAGRCAEAGAGFAALAETAGSASDRERALFGRASCLAREGQVAPARAALRAYLDAFPGGRFAGRAQAALSGL